MATTELINTNLETLLRDAEQRYIEANPNSQKSYQLACTAMPDKSITLLVWGHA